MTLVGVLPIICSDGDGDGNNYSVVGIGTQTWMAENLNSGTFWNSWCYGNNGANCVKYGRLYVWDLALNVCPAGWHLPTDDEWKELEIFLGMSQNQANLTNWRGTNEGKKLKSTSGWNSNGDGTDAVGYSALQGGYHATTGNFGSLGNYGYWWTSSENTDYDGWYRALNFEHDKVRRYYGSKGNGYSVRCVKD